MFVNTLADQREVRPQMLVDCGILLCPEATPETPRRVCSRARLWPPRRVTGGMLTWSGRRVLPGVMRVWERACVSLTRGTVMNRGCVFASRDLARCGTLQKCGQAAVAAETASQEPPPASPTSR